MTDPWILPVINKWVVFAFLLILVDSSTEIVMVDDARISKSEKLEQLKKRIAGKSNHINLNNKV